MTWFLSSLRNTCHSNSFFGIFEMTKKAVTITATAFPVDRQIPLLIFLSCNGYIKSDSHYPCILIICFREWDICTTLAFTA
jgi:hypothetical protein